MGDDAVNAVAGLLAEHRYVYGQQIGRLCACGEPDPYPQRHGNGSAAHRAHVASVIAAHMAALDELTALRERVAELEEMLDDCKRSAAGFWREIVALRERIRALADELTPIDERRNWPEHISNRVRALLGGTNES